MADFPIPIGLPAMFRDIAQGIGDAAQLVPQLSRSEVGALAVHRASVEINFEMSTRARLDDGTVGLGARTFLFGPSVSTGSNETTALNIGRITLEIVAITEPAPQVARPVKPPAVGAPGADDGLDAKAIRKAIGDMRARLESLNIHETEKRKIAAALEMALASLVAGDLATARSIIAQLCPGFDALAVADDLGADRARSRKRKKKEG